MTLVARHAAQSDIGLHRATNEDSFRVVDSLFVIADGMGGAKAGEIASQAAVETVVGLVTGGATPAAAAAAANRTIHGLAVDDEARKGMGTTLTTLVIDGDTGVVAHIGDSRLYRLRDGVLEQLTEDHSMVGQWLREGTITAEEAAVSRYRSVLTRALGTEAEAQVDAFEIDVRADDRLLLSTDGLHGLVSERLIADILAQGAPEVAARELVREAKNSGGFDNITVIVVRIDELDLAARGQATGAATGATSVTGVVANDRAAAGHSRTAGNSRAADDGHAADDQPAIAAATTPSVMAGVVQAPAAAVRSRRRHRLLVAGLLVVLLVLVVVVLVVTDTVDTGWLAGDEGGPASPAPSASPASTFAPASSPPASQASPGTTPGIVP